MPAPKPSVGAIPFGPFNSRLVSLWLLNQGPTTFVDSVNPANTGTVIGSGVTVTDGICSFTGAGYIGSITAPPSLGRWTLLARMKPTSLAVGFHAIYANSSIGLFLYSNGTVSVFQYFPHAGSVTIANVDAIGAWRTLAIRNYNQAPPDQTDYFVDGVADNSFAPGLPLCDNAANPLGIGGDTNSEMFVGEIDYIAIFTDTLTDDEIATITADPYGTLFLESGTFVDGRISQPLTYLGLHMDDGVFPFSDADGLNDAVGYADGYKLPYVGQWKPFRRGLSDRAGQVEHQSFGMTITDIPRFVRGRLDIEAKRYFPNRPALAWKIDDEDRRREQPWRMVANGFISNYSMDQNLKASIECVGWLRKKFTRQRESQNAWQPKIRPEDFDINTTPTQLLKRPAPWPYNPKRDDDLQTVADTDRSTGYLPDPTLGTPTLTGSPANPVTKRFYFTGMSGFYGNPARQRVSDHWGETLPVYVDQSVPDDQELRDQVNSGSASTYADFPITCPDAAGVRVYEADVTGANVKYLGLADDLGGGSFNFTYGKSSLSGSPLYQAGVDAQLPLRNNTYLPGTLTGGNVTTDTGRGMNLLIYVGLRLCLDGKHRAEFLAAACALANNFALYVGGVRLSDAEVDAYMAVPGRANWTAAFDSRQYLEVHGRRYCAVEVDRGYAIANKLISADELSAGENALTANFDGIEDIGDATGAPITHLILQALHFAENCLAPDRPVNAQAWVGASPITFTALPGVGLVNRASFLALADAHPELDNQGGVIGAFQEEVGALDAWARFLISGDFQTGESRLGEMLASREPDTIPDDLDTVDDVININDGSFSISDGVLTELWNVQPFRYGRNLSGRTTGGGTAIIRGQRVVIPELDEWQSTQDGEVPMEDEASQFHFDQVKEASQMDLFFIHDRTTARQLISRVLMRYSFPLRRAAMTLPLSGLSKDLGDCFRATHLEGVGADGWQREPVRVQDHTLENNEESVTLGVTALSTAASRVVAPYTFEPVTTVDATDFVAVP